MTLPSPISQPPTTTRHANPFATCWTRPGALPFRFDARQSAERLVARLASQGWRGTIVGPHGSGKSTLLEALKPALAAAGRRVVAISLHDGQHRVPREFYHSAKDHASRVGESAAKPLVFIIDGFEQLTRFERYCVSRRGRSIGAGLVVTSHFPLRMPTVIRLSPDRRLVERLVNDLCAKVSTDITDDDVAASHACHGSNVREILFDLYDRHEERRRRGSGARAAS